MMKRGTYYVTQITKDHVIAGKREMGNPAKGHIFRDCTPLNQNVRTVVTALDFELRVCEPYPRFTSRPALYIGEKWVGTVCRQCWSRKEAGEIPKEPATNEERA